MSVKVREIYYYSVCFVTLIISIFALTGLVNSFTQVAFPYPQHVPSKVEILRMTEKTQPEMQLTPEKLEEMLAEEQKTLTEREKAAQKHQIAREAGRNLSLLLVCVPLYLYHWRRVRNFEG